MAYGPTLLLIGLVAAAIAVVNWGLNWSGDKADRELRAAQATIAAMSAAQAAPTLEVVETVFVGSGSPARAAPVVGLVVEDTPTPIVVTATPTPTPNIVTEYREIYVQSTVEVTRIVEVTPVVLPTVTPIPLAAGTIKICVALEGAREVYIGQKGVVSGGCEIFAFGVGQTTISVQVNK